MREVIVNKNDSGQRLDKFLKKFMPKLPASMLYKGIRKNAVRINGRHAKKADIFLNEGDELKIYFAEEFFSEERVIKKASKPDACYEDENILIVNKPVGIPVHEDDRKTEETLISQIQYYLYEKGEYNPKAEKSFSPSLCNRIDRNTSGLVIAAKNAEALRFINEKIRLREIKKYYLCIAEGILKEKKGIFKASLERNEKKVSVNNTGTGKEIITAYEVLKEKDGNSLICIELKTGRTHQIRAQLAYAGHPLLGDVKYGAKKSRAFKYQALCSYKIRFDFCEKNSKFSYLNGLEVEIKPPFEI